jgi:hypothetical protein
MSPADTLWKRLKENQVANAPVFRQARIEFENVATLRCPSCGLEESALFWTLVGLTPHVARFTCPFCSRTEASYNLRRNRARGPIDLRRILLVSLSSLLLLTVTTGLVVRHGPESSQLDHALRQSWHQISGATGAVVSWVENTVRRGAETVHRR